MIFFLMLMTIFLLNKVNSISYNHMDMYKRFYKYNIRRFIKKYLVDETIWTLPLPLNKTDVAECNTNTTDGGDFSEQSVIERSYKEEIDMNIKSIFTNNDIMITDYKIMILNEW